MVSQKVNDLAPEQGVLAIRDEPDQLPGAIAVMI
jgi:hypothetical protein